MEQSPQKNEQSAEEQIAELTDLLQRTQANFENYRKQTEKRVEEIRSMAAKTMILQILPILDNFELAFKSLDPTIADCDFVKGMELIYAQFQSILENQNVTKMQTIGQMFDPYLHEALLKVENEAPQGTILDEFQHGYLLSGFVIRHAKVKISAGKKSSGVSNEVKNQHNINMEEK